MSAFEKKPSSPSTKPPTTHPFLLAISYSYSENTIKATQYRYVRQYSTVSNCKGNNIFNMTVFCDEEETNNLKFPMNEVKESHKITHQYVPSQCFYSLINVTLIAPVHIMTAYGREEVQLHTFLFLHNISLATKCSR